MRYQAWVALLGSLLTLVLILGMVLLPMFLLRGSRKAKLRTLGQPAAEALLRMVRFDTVPQSHVEDGGMTGVVDGVRDGEAIELRDSFVNNTHFINTGYETQLFAERIVVVGLRGATPKLLLTKGDVLGKVMRERFRVESSAELDAMFDAETERMIMDWAVMMPGAHRIEITPRGLAVSIPAGNAEDLERTIVFAQRLRTRILDTVEKHVRVDADADAYRVADAREPEEADEEDAGQMRS